MNNELETVLGEVVVVCWGYYPMIFVEGLKIAGVSAEIRTEHIPHTNLERYRSDLLSAACCHNTEDRNVGSTFVPIRNHVILGSGHEVAWLRNYTTSRKVSGSIPDEVIGFLN
jgi:hypothetical protein